MKKKIILSRVISWIFWGDNLMQGFFSGNILQKNFFFGEGGRHKGNSKNAQKICLYPFLSCCCESCCYLGPGVGRHSFLDYKFVKDTSL